MICARSGKFRNWMEKLLQQLSTLSGHVLTPSERKQLQEAQIDIKEAENKVISILLVWFIIRKKKNGDEIIERKKCWIREWMNKRMKERVHKNFD